MDLHLVRGDTRSYSFTLTQTAADGAVAPLDLTGRTPRFVVRRELSDAAPLITKEATVTGLPTAGTCDVDLVPADSDSLPNARAILRWEMQIEEGSDRFTALSGWLDLLPEVAQD